MKKKVWLLAPLVALLVGAICFFAGSLKQISYGAVYGNGIDIEGGASFTLSSGTIKASRKVDYGGGVSVTNGTFKMNGGTIEGNSATYGGGVYVGSSGTFTMSGGTIKSNTATYGSAIYISSGTFNYGGGTISGEIYTNTTININKKPSSALTINYSGVASGTRIAKVASGVTASASDYTLTNLPAGMDLEVQNISGTNYIVVAAASGITFIAEGNGTVNNQTTYRIANVFNYLADYSIGFSAPSFIYTYYELEGYNFNIYTVSIYYDGETLYANGEYFSSEQSVLSIPAQENSGSRFIGWFIDGKAVDNSLPRSERILNDGTIVTAKFESSVYTLTIDCGRSGSVEYGKVVGSGVSKVGVGYYQIPFKPGTTIKYVGGSLIVGDNKIQVYPKLGYVIKSGSLSGAPTGSVDSEGYRTTTPTANCGYTLTMLTEFFQIGRKLTIGCIGRQQLTRNETIMIYAALYNGTLIARGGSNLDAPLVDAAYYDEYTTEEIYAAIQPMITLTPTTTANMNSCWVTIGDMLAAYKERAYTTINQYFSLYKSNTSSLSSSNVYEERFFPIGNEISDVRGTEYNFDGYYVFWNPQKVSLERGNNYFFSGYEEGEFDGYGKIVYVDSKPNDIFKVKNFLEPFFNLASVDPDISAGEGVINYSEWDNSWYSEVNCVVFSMDLFAENSSQYASLIEQMCYYERYSGIDLQAYIEPLMSAAWRTMAVAMNNGYISGGSFDEYNNEIMENFGNWIPSTGLLENAMYYGNPGAFSPYEWVSMVDENKQIMPELVAGLRERWLTTRACDYEHDRKLSNQYFSARTFLSKTPYITLSELSGDYDADIRNIVQSTSFNAENSEKEQRVPEKEKNTLFFDNKKFYLEPIRKER